MSNQYKNIKTTVENNTFYLMLNRPEKRNALDDHTANEIEQAILEADSNDDVKVIVIQAAGEKVFASGADIKQLNEKTPMEALKSGMQGLYNKIESSSKPTIAAVNGFALGGGCELTLACDLRIATTKAKFGLPELNLAILPGAGGTQRLPRLIGKGRALDMMLSGRFVNGEEAENIGLAAYCVEPEVLEDTVKDIANKIAQKGPIAISLVKQAVHKGYDIGSDAALWMEKLSQAIAFGTEDKNEGTTAFLEKREANFKDK